jgi:hypothetical protein
MIDPALIDLRIAEHQDAIEQTSRQAWLPRRAPPFPARAVPARTLRATAAWLAPGRQDLAQLSTQA